MANLLVDVLVTLSAYEKASPSLAFPERRIILDAEKSSVPIGRASKVKSKGFVAGTENGWFDSPVMSRSHAEISADIKKKTVYIRDTGSLHGTFINDSETRVSKEEGCVLSNGDRLKFGVAIWRGPESFAPTAVQVGIQFNVHPTLAPRSTFQVPDGSDISDSDDDDNDSDDSSVKEVEAPTPVSARSASPGHLASDPIDLTPEENPLPPNPCGPSNLVDAPGVEFRKQSLIIDLSTDDDNNSVAEIRDGANSHVDALPAQLIPALGSDERVAHEDEPSSDNMAIDSLYDIGSIRSSSPLAVPRESMSHHTSTVLSTDRIVEVIDDDRSPHATDDDDDDDEGLGEAGGSQAESGNNSASPDPFQHVDEVDQFEMDDLESDFENDMDSEMENDSDSELEELEWYGDETSSEEDDASDELSHESVFGGASERDEETTTFTVNWRATPNNQAQPDSDASLVPAAPAVPEVKSTVPVRIEGLLNAARSSTSPNTSPARDAWLIKDPRNTLSLEQSTDTAPYQSAYADTFELNPRAPSPSDAAMPSFMRPKITSESLGLKSGKAEFFEAREQNKARASRMEGCDKFTPLDHTTHTTTLPLPVIPLPINTASHDHAMRSDSSASVQGSTAGMLPLAFMLASGDPVRTSPPPLTERVKIPESKIGNEVEVGSAYELQRLKLSLKAKEESTPAVSRRTYVGISDIVEGCQQSREVNKKRKAHEISEASMDELQWEKQQSETAGVGTSPVVNMMPTIPSLVDAPEAPEVPEVQEVQEVQTTSTGIQTSLTEDPAPIAVVPVSDPALENVAATSGSEPAASESAPETRPAKRLRLRDYVEPVGLVALGGLSVGAAVFAMLVQTAPAFD